MYKIMYLKTGNTFLLPENVAKELKEKAPEDYKILEKNGKKVRDRVAPGKVRVNPDSIRELVVDDER